MARDVEFNITASDRTGTALAAAERKFAATQDRIDQINKKHTKDRDEEWFKSAARIGRNLEEVFGKTAPKLVQTLAGQLATLGEASGPIGAGITAGLAVAAAAAAPAVGATISAAVIGGVAGGGVIGGVLLAVKDPRVQQAGKRLGAGLMASLQEDASGFIGPVLNSISKIEDRFIRLNGRIKNIFSGASGFLDPLVDGALNGVTLIILGVEKLVSRAGPVMDALGRSFEIIGAAIGEALDMVSQNSDDAASALEAVAHVIAGLIIVTAGIIRGLTKLYGVMRTIGAGAEEITNKFKKVDKATAGAVEGAKLQAASLDRLTFEQDKTAQSAEDAAATTDALTDAFKTVKAAADSLITSNRSLFRSETDVQAAFDDATESVKKNGRTLDANTASGRANRDALARVAESAQANYDAFVKLNGTGPASAHLAESLRAGFIKTAMQMGANRKAAEEYANKLLGIPSRRETQLTIQKAAALNAVKAVQTAVNALKGKSIHISVGVSYAQVGEAAIAIGKLLRMGSSASGSFDFARTGEGAGSFRTGGPTPVSVSNNVRVDLDGTPFYAMSVQASRDGDRRSAWRAHAGRR